MRCVQISDELREQLIREQVLQEPEPIDYRRWVQENVPDDIRNMFGDPSVKDRLLERPEGGVSSDLLSAYRTWLGVMGLDDDDVVQVLSFMRPAEGGVVVRIPTYEEVMALVDDLPQPYNTAFLVSIEQRISEVAPLLRDNEEAMMALRALRYKLYSAGGDYLTATGRLVIDADQLVWLRQLMLEGRATDEQVAILERIADEYGIEEGVANRLELGLMHFLTDGVRANPALEDFLMKKVRHLFYETLEGVRWDNPTRRLMGSHFQNAVLGRVDFDELPDELKTMLKERGWEPYIREAPPAPRRVGVDVEQVPVVVEEAPTRPVWDTEAIRRKHSNILRGQTKKQIVELKGEVNPDTGEPIRVVNPRQVPYERLGEAFDGYYVVRVPLDDEVINDPYMAVAYYEGRPLTEVLRTPEVFDDMVHPPAVDIVVLSKEDAEALAKRYRVPVVEERIGVESRIHPVETVMEAQDAVETLRRCPRGRRVVVPPRMDTEMPAVALDGADLSRVANSVVSTLIPLFTEVPHIIPSFSEAGRRVMQSLYASDLSVRSVGDVLRELGHGMTEEVMPDIHAIADAVNSRSVYFDMVHDADGVYRFKLKDDWVETLNAEISKLREDLPFTWFFHDDALGGYLLHRDLVRSFLRTGDNIHDGLIEEAMVMRLFTAPVGEIADDMVWAFASHISGDAEGFLRRIEEQLGVRLERLEEMVQMAELEDLIEQTLRTQGVVYKGDGWIDINEWASLTDGAKLELLRTLMSDDRMKMKFLAQFDVDSSTGSLFEKQRRVHNPVLFQRVLDFAERYGLNVDTVFTLGKFVQEHFDAFAEPIGKAVGVGALTPEGIGGEGIRKLLRSLRETAEATGLREDRALAEWVEGLLQSNKSLLGYDLFLELTSVPTPLQSAFRRLWSSVASYVFVGDAIGRKVAKQFLPLHMVRVMMSYLPVASSEEGKWVVGRSILGLSPTNNHPRALSSILKDMDIDPVQFYEFLFSGQFEVPEEWRLVWETYKRAGRPFELYVDNWFADLLKKDPFESRRDFFQTINDLYKATLVVYNPMTQIRNFTTNLLLMKPASGVDFGTAVGEFYEALRSAQRGDKLYHMLVMIDPSFSRLGVHEVPEGAEVFLQVASAPTRMFRWVANRLYMRQMHKLAVNSEALAKYALVRSLLKQKYGRNLEAVDVAVEDVLKILPTVNEWLVDYRLVPPFVQFLRRTLGFFPFITFMYTIASSFMKHPQALVDALFGTGKILSRIYNATGAAYAGLEQEDLRALLPEYMRYNPFLVAIPSQDGGTATVVDLSYWLPIGVFEPFFSSLWSSVHKEETSLGAIKGVGVGVAKTVSTLTEEQMGSLVKPLLELAVNRNFLTGQEIVNPNDPYEVQLKKRGAYLINALPPLRNLLAVLRGAGVEPLPLPPKSKASLDYGVLGEIRNIAGLKLLSVNTLAQQRYEGIEAQIREVKGIINRIVADPNMSDTEKMEMIGLYTGQINELMDELYRLPAVNVPIVLPSNKVDILDAEPSYEVDIGEPEVLPQDDPDIYDFSDYGGDIGE